MEHPGHRTSDNVNTTSSISTEQQQSTLNAIDQLPRDPDGRIELPRRYDEAPMDALVELIADMLQRLIAHNDQIPLSPEALTRFHSRSPPAISVLDYLRRIVRYANVERTCLLITLHYIDQLCARMPHFTLSSLTAHRFVIAAVVVASKALCDAFCTNAHYARVGGIRVGELNILERELLSAIDWRLTSTREVLDAYYVNLVRTHSTGKYVLAPPFRSTSPVSPTSPGSDSDMDSISSTSPQDSTLSVSISANPVPVPASRLPAMVTVSVPSSAPSVIAAEPLPLTAHHSSTHLSNYTGNSTLNQYASTSQVIEPSAVLISQATLSPRPTSGPTLEQNMAFASLRGTSSSAPLDSRRNSNYSDYDFNYEEALSAHFSPSLRPHPSPRPRPIIPIRSPRKSASQSPAVSTHSKSPRNASPLKSPLLSVSSRRSSAAYEGTPDKRVVPQRRPAVDHEQTRENNEVLPSINGLHDNEPHNELRPRTRPKIEQDTGGRDR